MHTRHERYTALFRLLALGVVGLAVGLLAAPADCALAEVSEDQQAVGTLAVNVMNAAARKSIEELSRFMASDFHSSTKNDDGSKEVALKLLRSRPDALAGIAESIRKGCQSMLLSGEDLWVCPPLDNPSEKVVRPKRVGFRKLGAGQWTFWFYVPNPPSTKHHTRHSTPGK